MTGLEFDPAKNAVNLRKHGVPPALGVDALADPNLIEREDRSMDCGEVRCTALGMVAGTVHVVVFTKRADRIRFISVRPADRHETDHYTGKPMTWLAVLRSNATQAFRAHVGAPPRSRRPASA
ncbi:BrnT family toxin [Azospirillum sp. RWY-5-1]|uniref:BrnT family toxin n=1 Tax=Azospirillum oleiclasticum TaxID=2735135 RepID=A0ABX2TML6_9PROT|nr:BrnT family toxin [Azospirillum oleiclasticum]NYZ24966.1 BrnT family toxin [Azospirillum oleiclasticum]